MIKNRNAIGIVFFLILSSLIIGIFFYRYVVINRIILSEKELECQRVAKIYSEFMSQNNQDLTEFLAKGSQAKSFSVDFIKNSLKFFSSLGAKNVILYDNSYTELFALNSKNFRYSNKKTYLLKNLFFSFEKFLHEVLGSRGIIESDINRWKTNSVIVETSMSYGKMDSEPSNFVVKTYCPIINPGDLKVNGGIEILTDITDKIDNLDRLTFGLLALFIPLLLLLYILVILSNRNIQSIINEQIKLNRQLEEEKILAEAESVTKTEFLANISHELRTPLNSIIGFSEIILANSKKLSEAQHIGYINDINNSGKHLLDLINDILDFSKAAAYKLKVENIDIDLNKICQSSMRFMKPKADEGGINLLEIFPDEHLVIKGDPKRLKQALLNLLSNSVKFTQSGGTVSMEIKLSDLYDKIMIIVKDNGIGIAQKDIPKALSVFQQIDNKLNRKYEGTGLGLPLTKKLIELMNGEFDIASEENVGTTVSLTFLYKKP